MIRSTRTVVESATPPVELPEPYAALRGKAHELKDIIRYSSMLCIDPSSGSRQSLPGWAIYRGGLLADHGVLEVPKEWLNQGDAVPYRLRYIAETFRAAWGGEKFGLLAMEDVKLDNEKGTLVNAIESLMLAKGAITSALNWENYIGVHAHAWRSIRPADYIKSDTSDAILIGELLIRLAREVI